MSDAPVTLPVLYRNHFNARAILARRLFTEADLMPSIEKRRASQISTTLYGKGVIGAWRQAGSKTTGLVILSPYLTADTTQQILIGALPSVIYTRFETRLFASGASSLDTVRALIAAGHSVYHLPNLHAKVVLARGAFASVGSQNLTAAGHKNHELTATFRDTGAIEAVDDLIEPWLNEAWLVTQELVDAMETEIEPLLELYRYADAKADEAQARLEQRRKSLVAQREQESRSRVVSLQVARMARQQRLHNNLAGARRSEDSVLCRMQNGEYVQNRGEYHRTLKALSGSLTGWRMEGSDEILVPQQRYLCIQEDTGAIGWVRLNSKSVTFVSSYLYDYRTIRLADESYRLFFTGERWPEASTTENIVIGIYTGVVTQATVRAFFDGKSMEILDVRPSDEEEADPDTGSKICQWIKKNEVEFIARVIPEMLKSYVPYEDRTNGPDAVHFFGGIGTKISMSLIVIHGEKVLVAKRVPPTA